AAVVAEDPGGSRPDSARAREELVEFPLTAVRRPLRPAGDLRVRTDHLGGDVRQLLIDLAPEELRRGALGPGRAAPQNLGEAAIAVELERLLGDPEGGHLLTDDPVVASPLLPHQAHQPV